jgi:hypothetical protein
VAAVATRLWRPQRQEWPDGTWFCEGPCATELLLEPEGSGGRWRWTVSQHRATAFEQRATGVATDRGKAAMAAERACRRVVDGAVG